MVNPLLPIACPAFRNILNGDAVPTFKSHVDSVFVGRAPDERWFVAAVKTKGAVVPSSIEPALAYVLTWALNEMVAGRGPLLGQFGVVTDEDCGKRVVYVSASGDTVEFGTVVDVGVRTEMAFINFGEDGDVRSQCVRACPIERLALCKF